MKDRKYYATYKDENPILVFDTMEERDEYIEEDWPDADKLYRMSENRAKRVAGEKLNHPVYDKGFGCMVVTVA